MHAFGEPEAQAQSNSTDPESAIIETSRKGFRQCYNVQLVVNGKNQKIVTTTVDQSAKDQGQLLPMLDVAVATHRMGEHLVTEEGRAAYAEKKWLSEAATGWIQEAPGFRRFGMRDQEQVQGEWSPVCLALNLRRIATIMAA